MWVLSTAGLLPLRVTVVSDSVACGGMVKVTPS